jgi:hypothetical protein
MAGEEPIAANKAIAAVAKNNEQNMRRHRDTSHMRFEFVTPELPGNIFSRIFVFIGVCFVEVRII